LFFAATTGAAMFVAWRAQLNRPPRRVALTVIYTVVAAAAVAATVPGQHYGTLGVIAFGLIGTAVYGALGLPVPGDNKHIFILLVPALLFHNRTWLLLVWGVAAFALGLALNRTSADRRRTGESMIAAGFAVTGTLCAAAEVWLAR